jgi:hypothetical protein
MPFLSVTRTMRDPSFNIYQQFHVKTNETFENLTKLSHHLNFPLFFQKKFNQKVRKLTKCFENEKMKNSSKKCSRFPESNLEKSQNVEERFESEKIPVRNPERYKRNQRK